MHAHMHGGWAQPKLKIQIEHACFFILVDKQRDLENNCRCISDNNLSSKDRWLCLKSRIRSRNKMCKLRK
jgi:hypothetical protein